MRDKPCLNRNINSAPLWLFDNISQALVFFHVVLFNLVSLFPSKYHYKTFKKKLFISIKQDLIISRDMSETVH